MASLFTCSYSAYGCIESIILCAFSIFTIYVLIKGLQMILRDNYKILDEFDRYTYYLALGQVAFSLIFFSAYPNNLIFFTNRSLRLLNEVVICSIFIQLLASPETYSKLKKVIFIMYCLIFLLWAITAIMHDYQFEYSCTDNDYIISSGAGMIIVSINAYLQIQVLQIIYQNEQEQSKQKSYDGLDAITQDEVSVNKKFTIFAFLVTGFLSLFIQFLWDYFSYTHSSTSESCKQFYISHSISSFILLIIVKLIVFFLHPWGIYYIQYWRNRKQLQYLQMVEEQNLILLLTDKRSELIEEDNDNQPKQQ